MHGRYDAARRRASILLLNGRSFPFTLRDTPIEVADGERVKLRILNGGMRTINLHAHGHRPFVTHLNGEAIDAGLRVPREHIEIGPGVTAEIELHAGDEKVGGSAPGVWIIHDHENTTSAARGGNPAGDSTAIVYAGFKGEDGLPRVATDLGSLFAPKYYEDGGHKFDPALFETVTAAAKVGEHPHPARDHASAEPAADVRRSTRGEHLLESHQFVARACPKPKGFRRIHLKAGSRFAAKGEAYSFVPNILRAEPCEEVELVMENTDAIRHAFMLPGLNPMVGLEFAGPGQRAVRFITPDEDITLEFHCHVEIHEKMGMRGKIIVGEGGERRHDDEETQRFYSGIGVVRGIQARKSRLVIDHEEIKDFMAPMVMSYRVQPVSLLHGLNPGDKISFTIDSGERAIVAVAPLRR
jgi:Cu/Ag efflux protein CusF/FtsP/CotA-like multicopper oxidase with cupredoxin domain